MIDLLLIKYIYYLTDSLHFNILLIRNAKSRLPLQSRLHQIRAQLRASNETHAPQNGA